MTNANQHYFLPALSFVVAIISAAGTVLPASARPPRHDFIEAAHCGGAGASASFFELPRGQRKSGFGGFGVAALMRSSGKSGDQAGVAFITPASTQGKGGFNSLNFDYQLGTGFTHALVQFCFMKSNGQIETVIRSLSSLPEAPGQTPEWGSVLVVPGDLGLDHTVTLVKTVISVPVGEQRIGYFALANGDNDFVVPVDFRFEEGGCFVLDSCTLE